MSNKTYLTVFSLSFFSLSLSPPPNPPHVFGGDFYFAYLGKFQLIIMEMNLLHSTHDTPKTLKEKEAFGYT